MKINRIDMIIGGLFILVGVYLFAQAPLPLKKEELKGEQIPIKTLFDIVAHENNVARSIWTKDIVVSGKSVGLKFSEDWKDKDVEAGPLPALLLREVSQRLEKSVIPLSLFLGSDYPIAEVNSFDAVQKKIYEIMKKTDSSKYFYDDDTQRYTAMYPDYAVSHACVKCHNEHDDSPKKDWKDADMMGATTWLHPKKFVTRDELVETLRVFRQSVIDSYIAYIEKLKTFKEPPVIGKKWPKEGYFIPSPEVFALRFTTLASKDTVNILLRKDMNSTDFK